MPRLLIEQRGGAIGSGSARSDLSRTLNHTIVETAIVTRVNGVLPASRSLAYANMPDAGVGLRAPYIRTRCFRHLPKALYLCRNGGELTGRWSRATTSSASAVSAHRCEGSAERRYLGGLPWPIA